MVQIRTLIIVRRPIILLVGDQVNHFAKEYARTFSDFLHRFLVSTWHYKLQIFEIPGLLTALLVNYDDQRQDEVVIVTGITYEEFLARMAKVKPDWAYFKRENFEGLAAKPHKTMLGWEGRTIYVMKGGGNPDRWSAESATKDATQILLVSASMQGAVLQEEAKNIEKSIPAGKDHYRAYEDFIRISINYLFNAHLGEAKAQARTEPGNEATEIRDLLAQNQAKLGVFHDLKLKYSCSEILVEAKNKIELDRDDLRQVYCYLKPAICLWGFIVCRRPPSPAIAAYNRTLFKNFAQSRGVLILTDEDIRTMISMKLRDRDPSEHIASEYSKFIRGV